MVKKITSESKKKVGIPAEVLEDLVSHITLRGMEFGDAEDALEEMKSKLGELAMAKVIADLPEEDRRPKACPRCKKLVPVKNAAEPRKIVCLSGTQTLKRNYHYCDGCRLGFHPRDIELGLPKTGEFSPRLERRILDFGVNDTYEECAERFSVHYEMRLSSNAFRQVVKRMGAQAEEAAFDLLQIELFEVPTAPAKTLYVMEDGSMLPTREGWKEAKVGVVFRDDLHVKTNENRRGLIDSARYSAVLGGQSEFHTEMADLLELEHAERAHRVVWIADGARGNWTLAKACSKYAVQILDFWHAVENGTDCGKVILDGDSSTIPLFKNRLRQLLVAGDVDALVSELMDCLPYIEADHGLDALNKLIGYYRNNETRMRYDQYIAMGLCIGSGAIESAHRHVLQKRMKLAGQHWGLRRGRQMARLRAAYRTGGAKRLHRAVHRAHRRTVELQRKERGFLRVVS